MRHKPSLSRVFCSRECKAEGRRVRPKNTPRACAVCSRIFTPYRGRGAARYCSKSCIWQATRGPEFNAEVARRSVHLRAARQRGTGNKGYIKLYGRHMHRFVAEEKLGRSLKAGEIVHHIDGNKHNNHPDNLAVMTQREHMIVHGLGIKGQPRKRKEQQL